MAILDSDIKQTSPKIVIVDSKYLAYLYRFDITNKSLMIYLDRYNEKSRNNKFLQKICCDFKVLEEKCDAWEKENL